MNINQFWVFFVLLLTSSCDRGNKIIIEDLYQSSMHRVEFPSIIIDNIQSIRDVVSIPNSNDVLLLGDDDERNIFTCRLGLDLIIGPISSYGGNQQGFSNKFIKDLSGNLYILGGTRSNTIGQNDFSLSKISYNGNAIWSNTYGTTSCDPISSGILDSQGRIIMVGATGSLVSQSCTRLDDFIIITDIDGNIIESIRIDFDENINRIENIVELDSNSYGVIHSSSSLDHSDDKILFSITSNLSDLSTFIEPGKSTPIVGDTRILPYEDGFIICTPIFTNNQSDILIQKVSSQGVIQEKVVIESECSESFKDCLVLSDGSIIVLGNTFESNNSNILICKVNLTNGVEWCNQYDLGGLDIGQSIVEFTNDELVIFGGTGIEGNTNTDVTVFKVSSIDGEVLSE